MGDTGVWCKCKKCLKKNSVKGTWTSISTARRHHLADLRVLLAQYEAPDDVVDEERDGHFGVDLTLDVDDEPVESSEDEVDDSDDEDDEADRYQDDAPNANDFFQRAPFTDWEEELAPEAGGVEMLVGEMLLTYFEWMCVHKPTNECARAVHAMISMVAPPGSTNMPAWSDITGMLDIVYKNAVIEVDICPNDCIAFVDSKHPTLVAAGYEHAHRTSCPKCGAARYKPETASGHQVPVKRGFYFPIDTFITNIFRDEQTQGCRRHDMGEFPPGHVRRSQGFWEKVSHNPRMNKEPRNQAFIGMADGIPLFRSLKTSLGVNVGAIRQANQPDHLSKMFGKIHLSFLYPGEYWAENDVTKEQYLQKAKPNNLSPLILMLVDDLLQWYDGKYVTDYSMAEDDPERRAFIRCVLLFWCGDYPGLGEATNFSHAARGAHACHWCNVEGENSNALNRMIFGKYRR